MAEKSFCIYIQRILKSIRPELHVSKIALSTLDSICRLIIKQIVDRAHILTAGSEKKTISVTEIDTAIQLFLNFSSIQKIIQAAEEACENFDKYEKDSPTKVATRESKAGIIFSVSTTEKYIRKFGQSDCNVSAHSPVFLAAVIQSILIKLLNAVVNVLDALKKITINSRHVFLGIREDKELSILFDNLEMHIIGSGVESHIVQNFFNKKRTKSNGKWNPGSKTVSNIKKYQKSTNFLIQHAPILRMIREIGSNFSDNLRYTKEFLYAMHDLIENNVIKIMKVAIKIVIHSQRETIYEKDIHLAREIAEPGLAFSEFKTSEIIAEASLRKLSLRAGVKRYGEDSTEEYRRLIIDYIFSFMKDIILCTQHNKLHTVNAKSMVQALSMRNINVLIIPHKKKSGKGKKSSKSNDDEKGDDTDTESVAETVLESDQEEEANEANEDNEDNEEQILDVSSEESTDEELDDIREEHEEPEDQDDE